MCNQKYIITPHDLVRDLKRISSLRDSRILILYLDLYIEYFVNAIYAKQIKEKIPKCEKCGRYIEPNFKNKVDKLVDIGLVKKKHKHDEIIKLIYKLRCKLVHDLQPNLEKLEKLIESHKPDIQEKFPLMSTYWKKTDPWIKIQLAAFPPVTALYQAHEKICGRYPKYTIIFKINPQATMVEMEIVKNLERSTKN